MEQQVLVTHCTVCQVSFMLITVDLVNFIDFIYVLAILLCAIVFSLSTVQFLFNIQLSYYKKYLDLHQLHLHFVFLYIY